MGRLTFLGTGTSSGVPVVGCHCPVCSSDNPHDRRTRSSVWIEEGGVSMLVDTSTDLRTQALAARMEQVDAVLFTHHHADHLHGIDELRIFNFRQKKSIPCYGPPKTMDRIEKMFDYIFDGLPPEGGGKPSLTLHRIQNRTDVGGVMVTPVPVEHGRMTVYGYRINQAAYVTDVSAIPESSVPLLSQLDTLILGALGIPDHPTHFSVDEALAAIERLQPGFAYLTHLDHRISAAEVSLRLPTNVSLAYDGLTIDI